MLLHYTNKLRPVLSRSLPNRFRKLQPVSCSKVYNYYLLDHPNHVHCTSQVCTDEGSNTIERTCRDHHRNILNNFVLYIQGHKLINAWDDTHRHIRIHKEIAPVRSSGNTTNSRIGVVGKEYIIYQKHAQILHALR